MKFDEDWRSEAWLPDRLEFNLKFPCSSTTARGTKIMEPSFFASERISSANCHFFGGEYRIIFIA